MPIGTGGSSRPRSSEGSTGGRDVQVGHGRRRSACATGGARSGSDRGGEPLGAIVVGVPERRTRSGRWRPGRRRATRSRRRARASRSDSASSVAPSSRSRIAGSVACAGGVGRQADHPGRPALHLGQVGLRGALGGRTPHDRNHRHDPEAAAGHPERAMTCTTRCRGRVGVCRPRRGGGSWRDDARRTWSRRIVPWMIRTYSGHSTAKASNELYRSNLAKGQTGLSIAFDLPTQTGLRPRPRPRPGRGGQGRRAGRPPRAHERAARRHPASAR